MPGLTDAGIRQALKRVERTGKSETAADGDGRGNGRLVLVLKVMPTRVTTDWMAQQWQGGKRVRRKIGAYPSMTLAEAREVFVRDYADAIQKGTNIKLAVDGRPGTVGDLFEGYAAALKATGKTSWRDVEKGLGKVAGVLGRDRPAREITPEEIVEAIRPIYDRGSPAMADHVRSYIRAAFSWGMKSELDYRSTARRRFRIPFNPAAGIPTEPKVRGTRWLSEDEFVQLYRWLECPDVTAHRPYLRALQLLMLTGQRVEEIARLHADQWDAAEQIIDWSKTKNGKPHAIPAPSLAAEILQAITPNAYGWFFPAAKDPSRPVHHGSLYAFTWRQRDRGLIPSATNRDIRRTFKTLGGKAGLSKEIRDRIQNHALQDVGSKNYDRWHYMPEKRAAMRKWDKYVRALLERRPPGREAVVTA